VGVLAIFGIDVADLVGQVIRALLDLLVPDFTGRWANRLVSWLVALPQVTDWRQFPDLNAFRRELTYVGYGLLSLTFAGAAMQAWAAGLVDGRPVALQAVGRAVLAAGALAVYPTAVAQLVLGVNTLTAAVIRHPAVADGINTAIGGAFVVGAVTSGLSLGLAAGALMAALFFLAAIFVMKVALTAMLCVLLISGSLVIALWPLPQGEGLVRLWGAGLVAAVAIPVSWALVFAVVGLVASDSLVGDQLGSGLEAAVKPFVAVACLYLVYKTPGFLVAHARMMGVRLGGVPGLQRGAPGETQLRRSAHGHAAMQRDRFRGLGAAASRSARSGAGILSTSARSGLGAAGNVARSKAATSAVNLVAAAGGQGRAADAVTLGTVGASRAASGAGRAVGAVTRGGKVTRDWWRRPSEQGADRSGQNGSGERERPSLPRVYLGPRDDASPAVGRSPRSASSGTGRAGVGAKTNGTPTPPRRESLHASPRPSMATTFGDDLRAVRLRQSPGDDSSLGPSA
jgi:hypothetical protein